MLKIKHLRTLLSLYQHGSLTKSAAALSTSQSALSHQIKELEVKISGALFVRKSQPLIFTEQGKRIIELAEQVLPQIDQLIAELSPQQSRASYSLGFACHACFQWVIPILKSIELAFPNGDFDYHGELFSDSLNLDILYSDDKPSHCTYHYAELGQFEQVLVASKDHPLAQLNQVLPTDLVEHTLLTYPLPKEQLDAFRRFLSPAQITPKHIRQVNNTLTMLQMINANYGVAIMPKWLVSEQQLQNLITISLGPEPLVKKLYLRIKPSIVQHKAVQQLVIESQLRFQSLISY